MLQASTETGHVDPVTAKYPKTFKRKLQKLISGPLQTVAMEITPEMASAMLEFRRKQNRQTSDDIVDRYGRDMVNGDWNWSNQGIGFNTAGEMFDGQHRLLAAVRYNVSFKTNVTFGLPEAAMDNVDQGRFRTPGQIFQINGVPWGNNAAAGARVAVTYLRGEIRVSSHAAIHPTSRKKIPTNELLEFVQAHPDFVDHYQDFHQLYKEFRVVSPSTLHAFHWLARQDHPIKADFFFESLCQGTNIKPGSPIHKLRQRLNRATNFNEYLSASVKAAFLVKAYNAYLTGKPLGILRQTTDEKFPRLVS